MSTAKVICAGFGGQGVMSMGQLLAYAGMIEGKDVSWLPSYGPEMRGGTANCAVTVSDKPIGSPIVSGDATCAIIMNLPSLDKFEKEIESGGVLLINSSLIDQKPKRDDIKAYYIPANELSQELGGTKFANMIMLGAYLGLSGVVDIESILEAFKKVFGPKKEKYLDINREAIKIGMKQVL
ncbi:MAG: 2-oxoacid:acceptor oxidoreductase family protein [Peptostreptococcaceae bacterium]